MRGPNTEHRGTEETRSNQTQSTGAPNNSEWRYDWNQRRPNRCSRWSRPNRSRSTLVDGAFGNKLCAWRHDMHRPSPPPVGAPAPRAPPSRRNVAVVSHAQYVLMVTAAPASRVKAAVVKQPGDLDLLTLKVVPESRVTWATSVPI